MLARFLRFRADMRYPCLLSAFGCVVFGFVLAVPPASAQVSSASLQGSITDPANAAVSRAQITVENLATGAEMHFVSNEAGSFLAPSLQPGAYNLRVGKQGFADVVIADIRLNVGDRKLLEIRLRVSSTHESVTVDGGGMTLNTADASVSTVIDRKFVENIPLNGRSFQDLISMTPGVVSQNPQAGGSVSTSGDFSVDGQRTESNYYTVDGVSGNLAAGNGYGTQSAAVSGSVQASTALGTTQSLVSVDALQEFRVVSSTYSAEYGRSPGGQFSLVTRSGSNELHGTAFDYLRNNYFDANDWFNDHNRKPMAPLRQNDFGGTVGGPLWIPAVYDGRNRSFFFFSYEGLRLTQPRAATIQYVPDTYLRQQAPEALKAMLNAFPVQNGLDYGSEAAPNLAQFIAPYSLPAAINSTSIRADHVITPTNYVFFRFAYTPSYTSSRNQSVVTKSNANTATYTLGWNSQVSNGLTNEFRLGYAREDATVAGSIDDFGGAAPADLASQLGAGGYQSPQSIVVLYYTGVLSGLSVAHADNRGRQWNLVDSVSLSTRHHTFKFGVDYRRIRSITSPASPNLEVEFLSPRSTLANSADLLSIAKYIRAVPVFNETALFAQDEWRVVPNLSLSLGLRWELNPPPGEADGNDIYPLEGDVNNPASLILAPRGTALWRTTWYNFAPRLGIAWTLRDREGWQTVFRSGGGVFFDTNSQNATQGFSGLGFSAIQNYSHVAAAATSAELDFEPVVKAPYTNAIVYAFPRHLQLPYTLQWNTSIEQSLGRKQLLTLSYVGANGRRLAKEQSLSIHSLNPNFGTVAFFSTGLTSEYQALQIGFQRAMNHGLQALGSYTWSHGLDYGSNYMSLALKRGNSDFDVRHNFSGGLSWDTPQVRSNGLVQAIANHWGIDGRLLARTAFPVTLQGSLQTDPATGNQYYSGLNLVAGQPVYLPQQSGCNSSSSCYPGGRILNKGAFAVPASGSSGNAPRNFVRGFDAVQMNLAMRRNFQLREKLTLQFRAETFNLLNHPNFGYVDPTYTSPTFGQATKMLNSSLGTLAAQYQQGGPRSMQLALRCLF